MKYFYGVNTNINLTIKCTPKTTPIILMSRTRPGHCRAPLLKRSTFRAAGLFYFPLLEQLL